MSNKITINGFDISKTKVADTEYKISIFRADKLEFQFNVSLQPTGKDDVLPTYQLTDKSQTISEWATQKLNLISDWIIKDEK